MVTRCWYKPPANTKQVVSTNRLAPTTVQHILTQIRLAQNELLAETGFLIQVRQTTDGTEREKVMGKSPD